MKKQYFLRLLSQKKCNSYYFILLCCLFTVVFSPRLVYTILINLDFKDLYKLFFGPRGSSLEILPLMQLHFVSGTT